MSAPRDANCSGLSGSSSSSARWMLKLVTPTSLPGGGGAGFLGVAAHRADRCDAVVLVDLDDHLGAVGLGDVRLIGRAVVDVGLHAVDGAGHLRQRGCAYL